jgi:hypothetical protein
VSPEAEGTPGLRSCCTRRKSPEFTALERARRGAEAVMVADGVVEAAEEVWKTLGKLSPGSEEKYSGRLALVNIWA